MEGCGGSALCVLCCAGRKVLINTEGKKAKLADCMLIRASCHWNAFKIDTAGCLCWEMARVFANSEISMILYTKHSHIIKICNLCWFVTQRKEEILLPVKFADMILTQSKWALCSITLTASVYYTKCCLLTLNVFPNTPHVTQRDLLHSNRLHCLLLNF